MPFANRSPGHERDAKSVRADGTKRMGVKEMQNIELSALVDLMAARIRRVNRSINEETAGELAAEVRDIIACVQRSYSAGLRRSSPDDEEIDVVRTFLRTVVDTWPSEEGDAANDSVWLMERLTDIDDELYRRYMRLCDRVNGTDFSAEWGLA
jgi:hypothetical protein